MILQLLSFFLPAFAVSLTFTLLAERFAPKIGVVARPVADRWHRQTVPLLGGVAIILGTVGPMLLTGRGEFQFIVLALAAFAMGCVGLVDDVRALSPQIKLLAQILLAATLLQFGFVLRLTGFRFVDVFVTLLWLIAITNAFNLLDNMDGLSATIALVAAGFRLLFFQWEGEGEAVRVAAIFMGAIAGFLVRNFPPAKIFMGDAGSLFLGFFLAGLSLGTERAYSRGVAAVLVIPVLLLLIPIFDTAFVTATRLMSGRSVAVGGRDHTSHRLVAIGLTERQTVLLLAALSAAVGGVAVLSYRVGVSQTVVVLALLVIALVLLGIYLSRVRIVQTAEERNGGAVLRLIADFQYKRQVMTLLLDVCLILVAYYAAYVIRFEQAFQQHRSELYSSLPIVLLVQLVTFAAFGLYRGIWQYTSVTDVLRMAKAVTVGTMVTMVVLVYTHSFRGFSRTVFILDWLLLIVLLGGSRASFRFLAEMFRLEPKSFQRVLIYGAGDGGELIVRELLNNPALQRVPIGFIDDDRGKHQTRIHGLPVFGGVEQLRELLSERRATELIVSSSKIRGNGLETVTEICHSFGVPVRRASFRLE
jgi:UDP-GlcNAc:undecaprenyl-phosphate GlcNAc-1-phosphate transferase